MSKINKEYLHSVVFGIEDSLVSTTGLIAGLSVGANNKQIVLLGGAVAIAIEAVSMGAGEYLSDDAVAELDKNVHQNSITSGALMFISYLLAGFIPLLPVIILEYPYYLYYSILLAFLGLFLLGYIKGKVLGTSSIKGGIKILIIGGLATLIGVVVGLVFRLQ